MGRGAEDPGLNFFSSAKVSSTFSVVEELGGITLNNPTPDPHHDLSQKVVFPGSGEGFAFQTTKNYIL